MNQIKDDAEQFRKMKAEMTKEVLQLKSKVQAFGLGVNILISIDV